MNQTFKYIGSTKYSLKGVYTGNNFSVLNVYLNGKLQSVNTFKDRHIVAKSGSTSKGYDKWPLPNTLWMKFYKVMANTSFI